MEKKRINKLIVPFTRKTLSILSAATIFATSMGCNNKDKNKDNNSDISIPTSSSSSMEEISSELDIIESIDSSTKETSSVESTNSTTSSSKESQTSAKPSSGSTTSNIQSSNKKPSSSQSSSNNASSGTSINSSPHSTPDKPMPASLTSDNINDISNIDYFADPFSRKLYTVKGEALYTWINYYYNGVMYDCKKDELRMIILLFNYDYIGNEVLENMFSDKSLDDITRYSMIIRSMCGITFEKKANFHYENFVVNNDKKSFLKDLESSSRNANDILAFSQSFYAGTNNYFNYGDDIVLDYYVYLFASKAGEVYNNEELTNIYINYANSYVDFKTFVQTFYAKSRAKTLIK